MGQHAGMTDKPSYLGLLNAISNAEGEAHCYLTAWAEATRRDDVRAVIETVALREGEHGLAFAKRMCELGFGVMKREDPKAAERMAIACSATLSDLEKFEQLGLGEPEVEGRPDIFAGMFADSTIDIQTGALLGRYIAEERDSGRLLRACRSALESEAASNGRHAAAANGSNGSNGSNGHGGEDRLGRIEDLLERLLVKLDR